MEGFIVQTCPYWGNGTTGGMGMGGLGGGGMGTWGTGFGILWPLLWLVGLVVILVIVGYVILRRHERGGSDRAVGELRQRYARGEIDADEFERRRRQLLEG